MADDISIHAPRAGSDRPLLERTNIMAISIHAPRAGSDLLFECIIPREMSFQSTLPVRGATDDLLDISRIKVRFQSTLPVRGATLVLSYWNKIDKNFNPRSPCGERQRRWTQATTARLFQSTLPVRGATLADVVKDYPLVISIHAPRAGSDRTLRSGRKSRTYFNPRSPCGERQRRCPKRNRLF